MINQRQFGVEIECLSNGYGVRGTAQLLRKNGFSNWAENVYHDGSEVEIPSPILKGKSGFDQLEQVMGLLVKNGFAVTNGDGMHVHHDVSDLSTEQVLNVAESWRANQSLIKSFVAPHRRNGPWSRDLGDYDIDAIKAEVGVVTRFDEWGEPVFYHDKYKALSLESRDKYGTLEIRLHEGTLDFKKARAWILFGQAFITNTAKKKKPVQCVSTTELLNKVGVYSVAKKVLVPA